MLIFAGVAILCITAVALMRESKPALARACPKFAHNPATVSGFDSNYYFASNKIAFPNEGDDFTIGGKTYKIFSGSYQEIRYYNSKISESNIV